MLSTVSVQVTAAVGSLVPSPWRSNGLPRSDALLDPEHLERITVRRVELDEPEEQLAEMRAERTNLPSLNVCLSG